METRANRLWDAIASLKLTIGCLVVLMVLVVACTLAQVELGTLGAVKAYIRTPFVLWRVPGTAYAIPVLPGGGLVGLLLLVNLIAAGLKRFSPTVRKFGLSLVHAGLIVLFVGEFVTSLFQVELQLAIEEGQTLSYVESPRDLELAVIDTTDPKSDAVYGVPEAALARGGEIALRGTPLTLRVKRFFQNAALRDGAGDLATAGVGPGIAVTELAPVHNDDQQDLRAAWVEPIAAGKSYGVWLVSNGVSAPQSFTHEGRTYALSLRLRREYLPYALTLKKFRHDVYAGTDIPKNFSSLVHLSNPATGEERDVLISMNQPLRYAGKAFYQASFGKNDTLSVLQVVQNPGWLLPYLACALVAAGLLFHFGQMLVRATARRRVPAEA
jgi:hypothetical protein